MARDTSFDDITYQLIQRIVTVLKPLSGWGLRADNTSAVYGHLGLPMPQEPFPACYCYLSSQTHDNTQGASVRRDINTVTLRIIGGPVTPTYKVNPEDAVYRMITAVVNELDYRPYLQDPTAGQNNATFRYVDPYGQLTVGTIGQIRAFNYSEQGSYVGIEIPVAVALVFNMGRVS